MYAENQSQKITANSFKMRKKRKYSKVYTIKAGTEVMSINEILNFICFIKNF